MKPDFTGVWKLIRGGSEFGFLPAPSLRIDVISQVGPQFCVRTRQKDTNGDVTVDRNLTLGGNAIEINIRGRARRVRAAWDECVLVVETLSEVSGNTRRLVDRRTLDPDGAWLTLDRLQEQPGGDVRQTLRFRRLPKIG